MNLGTTVIRKISETGCQIRDAQLARAALPPLRRLSDLVQAMEEHRRLSARLLAGDARDELRRQQLAQSIGDIQSRTRPLAAEWERATTDWRLLRRAVDSRALEPQQAEAWHDALLATYRDGLRTLEQLDGRLARRVDDLRREQCRNLGGGRAAAELPCG